MNPEGSPAGTKTSVKLGALALVLVVSLGLFVGVDLAVSYRIRHNARNQPVDYCVDLHPTRHHAFRPMCSGANYWGKARYPVYTNDLGLRDSAMRRVPLKSDRKRVLFLGDSFTDGSVEWSRGWVGLFALAHPELDVLNGGAGSYSPSNYLNLTRELLGKGVVLDEVIVFMDISDVQDEAAYYTDTPTGALTTLAVPASSMTDHGWAAAREWTRTHLVLTDILWSLAENVAVRAGRYALPVTVYGDVFNMRRSAWTYASDLDRTQFPTGYAPRGVAGGIARAESKMDSLASLLGSRGISLSVAVYPWPAQLAHDSVTSRAVTTWKRWCDTRGCKRFIDGFAPFFAAKSECPALLPGCWYSRLFTFGDVHYNEAGYAMVADRLIAAYKEDP